MNQNNTQERAPDIPYYEKTGGLIKDFFNNLIITSAKINAAERMMNISNDRRLTIESICNRV